MLFTLNRDHVHRSTLGVISFAKGKPTFVPPVMHREVYAIGAEPAEPAAVELLDPEKVANHEPVDAESRFEELAAAYGLIVERNNSRDFTGAGRPTIKAIEKIVGFTVDEGEANETWQRYREALANEQAGA